MAAYEACQPTPIGCTAYYDDPNGISNFCFADGTKILSWTDAGTGVTTARYLRGDGSVCMIIVATYNSSRGGYDTTVQDAFGATLASVTDTNGAPTSFTCGARTYTSAEFDCTPPDVSYTCIVGTCP
jgi:hypothetical protein